MLLTQDMENYKCLREHFLASCQVDDELFANIKKSFEKQINSPRKFDNITTMEQLLRTLEKRGLLSFDNILPLRLIVQIYIKDTSLDATLAEFEKQFPSQEQTRITRFSQVGKLMETENEDCRNSCEVEEALLKFNNVENNANYEALEPMLISAEWNQRGEKQWCWDNVRRFLSKRHVYVLIVGSVVVIALIFISYPQQSWAGIKKVYDVLDTVIDIEDRNTLGRNSARGGDGSKSIGQTSQRDPNLDELQSLVLLQLSERLGNQWRDLARYLNIQESQIDEMHVRNSNNFRENSKEILQLYFLRTTRSNWKIKLLEALEKIRRRDLKELVLELFRSDSI